MLEFFILPLEFVLLCLFRVIVEQLLGAELVVARLIKCPAVDVLLSLAYVTADADRVESVNAFLL